MTAVLAALLLATEAGSGAVSLSVGAPEDQELPGGAIGRLYPVTASWDLSCDCADNCGQYYRSVRIAALDENVEMDLGTGWWSGSIVLTSPQSSGTTDVWKVEPGRVIQASLESWGCIDPVKSGRRALPPWIGKVSLVAEQGPFLPECFVTGMPVFPSLLVWARVNPGETIEYHFSGAGLNHVETLDSETFGPPSHEFWVSVPTDGDVDIWVVHSTAGESNHLTVRARADGCMGGGGTDAGGSGNSSGSPDTSTGKSESQSSGCGVASAVPLAAAAVPLLVLAVLVSASAAADAERRRAMNKPFPVPGTVRASGAGDGKIRIGLRRCASGPNRSRS